MRSSAVFFLVLGAALAAFAGAFGTPPTIASVTASPTSVGAGGTTTIAVNAVAGSTGISQYQFSAPAGTFSNGQGSITVVVAGSTTCSVPWTAPSSAGSVVVTATVFAPNPFLPSKPFSNSGTVTVTVGGSTPLITSLVASPAAVKPGASSRITCQAFDPGGAALTFAWSATGGALDPTGASANWTAPLPTGFGATNHTVTVTVTNPSGASNSASVVITPPSEVRYLKSYVAGLREPLRLAFDKQGNLYVTDSGRVIVLDTQGRQTAELTDLLRPMGIAVLDDRLYVGEASRGAVSLRKLDGTFVRWIGAGANELPMPLGICTDGASRIWVVDAKLERVRCYDLDGAFLSEFGSSGTSAGQFSFPSGITYDKANARLLVADQQNRRVQFFTTAGLYAGELRNDSGTAFGRIAGVSVGPTGRIYVADTYQARVAVFDLAGTYLYGMGSLDAGPEQVSLPADVAVSDLGKIAITSPGTGQIQVFAIDGIDSDGDGMPDAWETAHGLNPLDPGDALLDPDGDGLTNLAEFRLGTDPRNLDTDGDGVSDGVEVAEGTDPLDVRSHRPRAVVHDLSASPALLTLDGTGSFDTLGYPLTWSWQQVSGPSIAPIDSVAAPKLVLRQAGDYVFELTVSNGVFPSLPARATVRIANVAPDAALVARPVVVTAGTVVTLDGSASRDANGDPTTFSWVEDATNPDAGLVNAGGVACVASVAQVCPLKAGTYRFTLAASDGTGSGSSTVLVVVNATNSVPTADPGVGVTVALQETVRLDGRASSDPDGDALSFRWSQVSGPAVVLVDAGTARPSFVATAPGVLGFELVVSDGRSTSPAAPVTIVVQGPASHGLPTATVASPALLGTVLGRVALAGGGLSPVPGATFTYEWKQVAGPERVHLEGTDQATAGFVPLESGLYAFELRVNDGTCWSPSARVDVTAAAIGNSVPTARAQRLLPGGWGPVQLVPGRRVSLDASTSSDPDRDVLAFRWVQTAGPRVVLSGDSTAVADFEPALPGVYGFDVVVSDGYAPSSAHVEVVVNGNGRVVPTARASGPASELPFGSMVRLQGNASSGSLTWSQRSGPVVQLDGRETGTPSFVGLVAGTYVFDLYAEDDALRSQPAEVTVVVAPAVVATGASATAAPTPAVTPSETSQPDSPVVTSSGGAGGCTLAANAPRTSILPYALVLLLLCLRRAGSRRGTQS